ncbi:MAG: hypothetical protein ACRDZM_16855, partial [Acidimicrobiia bacterium]
IRGGSWWGPLHSFLAGTVLLAISGASQMFTITWSASPAPRSWFAGLQRWLVAGGVAGVLVGVTTTTPWLSWVGAVSVAGGLITLAISIVSAVRRSLLRRFDLSARFYLLAFAAGIVGVTLGAIIGSGTTGQAFRTIRLVHSHLNLLGLVGFTIIGTIPTFLPTVAHHRAVSGIEAKLAWWLCAGGSALLTSGLALPPAVVGLGTMLIGLAGAMVLGGVLARLWSKGRQRLSFLQIGAGVTWLIAWALVDGANLLSGGAQTPFNPWTAAAVVAGVGQVLLGSLAYLLPVLLGRSNDGRKDRGRRWPAIPLALANLAGLALAAGFSLIAITSSALWLADFVLRLLRPASRDKG